MEKVRCKFTCRSVKASSNGGGDENLYYDYEFSAVADSKPENNVFWKYTPNGELRFSCTQQKDVFIPGKDYYIDILPVDDIKKLEP